MAADRRMIAKSEDNRVSVVPDVRAGIGVDVDSVSKSYAGQKVVDDISLNIAPGECLALLGPNGAGKTTLFKMILGLVRPDGGALHVDDLAPQASAYRAVRSHIGYLPENVSFHGQNTGSEMLAFYARLKGVPTPACGKLLERVGLSEAAGRRIRTYSKGMRQRLGLAQALLGKPRMLILDEPTTGLDPDLRRQFFEILRGCKEAGITILISSHALMEIEAQVDRYAILKDGRLAAGGTLDELQQEATLPIHIHLTVAHDKVQPMLRLLETKGQVTRTGRGRLKLQCPAALKVPILRQIMDSKIPIQDIEVRDSHLVDIYVHFLGGERPS